jgi:hypothetical protein
MHTPGTSARAHAYKKKKTERERERGKITKRAQLNMAMIDEGNLRITQLHT